MQDLYPTPNIPSFPTPAHPLLRAQELKGNIRVFCRVRPISAVEQASSDDCRTMSVECELHRGMQGGFAVHAL